MGHISGTRKRLASRLVHPSRTEVWALLVNGEARPPVLLAPSRGLVSNLPQPPKDMGGARRSANRLAVVRPQVRGGKEEGPVSPKEYRVLSQPCRCVETREEGVCPTPALCQSLCWCYAHPSGSGAMKGTRGGQWETVGSEVL